MDSDRKMISFSAIGLYAQGLMAKITSKIFELNGNIVDVEENCRRGLFSIFLIIRYKIRKNKEKSQNPDWPMSQLTK